MRPSKLILITLIAGVLGSDEIRPSTPAFNSQASTQDDITLDDSSFMESNNTPALNIENSHHLTTEVSSATIDEHSIEQLNTELVEVPTGAVLSTATPVIVDDTSIIVPSHESSSTKNDISIASESISSLNASIVNPVGVTVPTVFEELGTTSLEVNTTPFNTSTIFSESEIFSSDLETATMPDPETNSSTERSTAPSPQAMKSDYQIDSHVNSSVLKFENNTNRTEQEDDLESHFMSFEEWKKQKVGKDLPPVRELKSQGTKLPAKQINQNINGAIGEEMEIDLGMFSGTLEEDEGGKLYKDRFNYASFDCAATIVKTNSEAKGASSILNENKDSYLLNECRAPNKFVTIELCQDILVDTVLIGNYEFFSSTFKNIRLSVSDRFPVPVNGWTVLGEFEAENVRALQTFNVKNPLIWARYLRLEVLSYYGSEYYCPISVIRVHGQTMIDEFKNEEESIVGDEISKENAPVTVEMSINSTLDDSVVFENVVISKDNKTISTFDAAVVDPDKINTLHEECSVVLPHLGIEQFLEELYSTEKDFCSEEESALLPAPVETKEPTTQESIYKNIVKRLSLLESNASLSLLYIEEQSKLLSDAFTKLENRQKSKFDLLVTAFNESIHVQISQMKNLYTNLHQETAVILTHQRRTHRELLLESSRKVNLMSSQLTFFKRLSIVNTIVIICLLVYVVATRETYIETEYIEDEDGSWHDFTNSPPGSPSTLDSPTNSFVNIDKLNKKKKKIKFSVSHKLGSGAVTPLSSGSFYINPNHSHGNSSDDHSIRHRRSISSSLDGNSIKSGGIFSNENGNLNGKPENTSEDESVELDVNQD